MDSETEVIRQQMEGTRTALADKLEKLEEEVTEKVQDATSTVAETVEAVSETVENVTETVEETVQAVKRTFDLQWQAEHNPWLLVGGSVLAGYLGGVLLFPARRRKQRSWVSRPQSSPSPTPPEPSRIEQPSAPSHGWLSALGEQFSGLKKLAIGTALGVVREMVTQAVPAQLGPPLSEAIDNLTTNLGGEPLETTQASSAPAPEPEHSSHFEEESCGAGM
jgi:ElaB/YqjD/DUF883 family membrane-anchored ribosome-binding protein